MIYGIRGFQPTSRHLASFKPDWNDTLCAFAWMLVCLEFFAIINGGVLVSTGSSSGLGKYLGRELYVSLVLALPVLFAGRCGRGYAIVLFLGMGLFTAVNWVHNTLFGVPATSYLLGVARETYTKEIYAFIEQFVDAGVIWRVMVVFLVPLPALLLSLRRHGRSLKAALAVCGIVAFVCGIRIMQRDFISVLRWHYVADTAWSCVTAHNEQMLFSAAITQAPELPGDIQTDAANRLLVLVLGESSGRHHYGLYGYARPTTPLLEQRASDLLIFTNVISAHAHTIPALQKSLTFANHEGDQPQASLIDVLNAAGYHTIVLSNQPWLGKHETASSRLLERAKEIRLFNTSNVDAQYQTAAYDQVLLEPFAQAVRQPGNVAILVHLMGSHTSYHMRYPSSVTPFSDTPPSALQHTLTRNQQRQINTYDTSIAYTDIILDQLLTTLEQVKRPSALLYFSDHSEAMYEDGQTLGHAENAGSRYMFEIPFFLWLSPAYRQERPDFSQALPHYIQRPWQTDDLIFPALDLAGVTFEGFKTAKNIFSPAFVPEKRPMGDKDYDAVVWTGKQETLEK